MKKGKVINFILAFLLYFIIQYKFLNDWWFTTDELDIMVLGKGIARGKLLYKDLCSQHMPFSYYISAFFDKIGFRTVDEQRIAFYILIAFLWALIYLLYSDVISSKVLLFSPIVLCSLMQNYEYGTQVLSEHLVGCGATILFLEYLNFIKEKKKISLLTCIMISISIVLTFGTVFVGIYAVFFIGLGVLVQEIKWLIEEKVKITTWILYMLKKYVMLVAVVLIPWIVLLGYYTATGTIRDFIYGAYTLNRTIYATYIGGMGSDILSLFLQPLDMIGGFISSNAVFGEMTYAVLLQWLVVVGGIMYIGKKWSAGERKEAIIILMFTYSLGVRGVFNFHGTPCVEILSLLSVDIFINDFVGKKDTFIKKSIYAQSFVYVIIFFVLSGYFRDFSEIATIRINDEKVSREAKIVNHITDYDESVWCFGFHNEVLMLADRTSVNGYPSTPWTWEAYKKKFKNDINQSARVILYDEEHEVWGYVQTQYAPEIARFMNEQYTRCEDTCIYIRNDYYEEVKDEINEISE